MPDIDGKTALYIVGFLCLVAAFPTPEEVSNMSLWKLAYTILYRFFNQLCVNARHLPGINSLMQIDQSQSLRRPDGTLEQSRKIETSASATTPPVATIPNETKGSQTL